jgi:hypothetical protein
MFDHTIKPKSHSEQKELPMTDLEIDTFVRGFKFGGLAATLLANKLPLALMVKYPEFGKHVMDFLETHDIIEEMLEMSDDGTLEGNPDVPEIWLP